MIISHYFYLTVYHYSRIQICQFVEIRLWKVCSSDSRYFSDLILTCSVRTDRILFCSDLTSPHQTLKISGCKHSMPLHFGWMTCSICHMFSGVSGVAVEFVIRSLVSSSCATAGIGIFAWGICQEVRSSATWKEKFWKELADVTVTGGWWCIWVIETAWNDWNFGFKKPRVSTEKVWLCRSKLPV